MRKLLFLIFFAPLTLHAQGIRFDSTVEQQGTIATTQNAVILPAAPIVTFCNAPANAVPCTNKATTYTDATLATSCPTSRQIVLAGTISCVSSPDVQNNWGVWLAPGQYAFTVTVNGVNQGPWYVTAALSFQTLSGTAINLTAQQANIGATPMYTTPANGAGFYRFSCYLILTQAATTSSTLPNCTVQFTDFDTGGVIGLNVSQQSTANAPDTIAGIATGFANYSAVVYVRANTIIYYGANNYASSGATPMQYALHARLEYLGP